MSDDDDQAHKHDKKYKDANGQFNGKNEQKPANLHHNKYLQKNTNNSNKANANGPSDNSKPYLHPNDPRKHQNQPNKSKFPISNVHPHQPSRAAISSGTNKPYLHPNDQRKHHDRQNPDRIPSSLSALPTELRNLLNQLNTLAMNADQLDQFICTYTSQWLKCWQVDTLNEYDSLCLINTFARLPYATKAKQPSLIDCSRVLDTALKTCLPHEKIQRVETVLNFIRRMLHFEWDSDVDDVRTTINCVLDKATSSLDFKITEQKRLQAKVIALSDELDKPWSIKTRSYPQALDVVSQPSADVNMPNDDKSNAKVSLWMAPNLAWLTESEKFCPPLLPKMCVPGKSSNGVYRSLEEYFDIVQRLWTAITFSDGSNMFNASCRWRDKDKECGHVLWPITTIRIKCSTNGCLNHAVIACCNQNHPFGVCAQCNAKIKSGLKGPPGPQACTHVYDCVVSFVDWDDRLLITNFESRKPPQKEIHWHTTRRLSCSNLIGIIKTSHRGATLSDTALITWAEIVAYDRTPQAKKFESKHRADKKLSVSLLNLDGSQGMGNQQLAAKVEFKQGDTIAIIDCMTFVPEQIPVLMRLEMLSRQQKPFNDLQLLNIGPNSNPNADNDAVDVDNAFGEIQLQQEPPGEVSASRGRIQTSIYELVKESKLEPIIQIRRDPEALSILVSKLAELAREVKLDDGQFQSFISSLLHPVHCTQGPPGTGKSYLGVVITRALLIIRKLWMHVNPSVGSPPVLILSYKNHAIDELTVDLVNAQQNVRLVRIGRSDDERLAFYNERCRTNEDPGVVECLNRLKTIHNLKDILPALIETRSNLTLSKYDFAHADDDKTLYDKTECLSNAITSLKMIFQKIFPEKTNVNELKQDDFARQFDYEDIQNAIQHYTLAPGKQILNSSNIETLHCAAKNYDGRDGSRIDTKDILLHWMKGCQIRAKCESETCTNPITDKSKYCHSHTCSLCSCSEFKSANAPYCQIHSCKANDCMNLSLRQPQIYCEDHVCVVCITKSPNEQALLAQDTNPRNTCDKHQLCAKQDGCRNLVKPDTLYCEHHVPSSAKCQSLNRNGKQCGSKPKPNTQYCKDHQANDKSTETNSVVDSIQQQNWTIPEQAVIREQTRKMFAKVPIFEKPSMTLKIESQIEAKPTNSSSKIEKTKTAVVQPAQVTTVQPSNNEATKESAQVSLQVDAGCATPIVEDEVERCQNDNLDEFEESEHMQHIRDIYTADDGDDEEDLYAVIYKRDATLVESDDALVNGNASDMLDSSKLIMPNKWCWTMQFEDRWQAIDKLIAFEKSVLLWLNQQLVNQVGKLRQEHHLAKIKANSRVYQDAELIAGTIVGCISRLEAIQATNPFAVVVEEASEVSEPILLSCFAQSTCKLELIGDHFQLQPSMMSKFDFERINKMNMSLFERLVRAPRQFSVPFNVLSLQRRMRRNICDLTRSFYTEVTTIIDHPICHTKCIKDSVVSSKKAKFSMNRSALISNDLISKCEGEGREVPGVLPHVFFWHHSGSESAATVGLSKVNIHEADMVCALAAYLVKCGVPRSSIAILTPYKGQMMLLRSKLKDLSIYVWDAADTCRLSTVDRFQGDEADVVVISMVIGSKSTTPFVKLVNRMIVALSRARLGLYIVANLAYFENNKVDHWEATLNLLSNPATNDTMTSLKSKSDAECFTYSGPCIGDSLPICCPYHRGITQTKASRSSQLKLDFCKEKCPHQLPCSHYCARQCHWSSVNDHQFVCSEFVSSPCMRHPRELRCSSVNNQPHPIHIALALKKYKCDVTVDVCKPCMHADKYACHEEMAIAAGHKPWPTCTMPSHQPYQYPVCKHFLKCTCHQYNKYTMDPSQVEPCAQLVDYTPKCGHTVQIKCYLKHQLDQSLQMFSCTVTVQIVLPRCLHTCQVACSIADQLDTWQGVSSQTSGVVHEGTQYGPKDHDCNQTIRFVRLCGHVQTLKCEKAFEFAKSAPKCEIIEKQIENPECGHIVDVKCFEKQILSKLKRTKRAIEIVDEANPTHELLKASNINIKCQQSIKLLRKCGHEESIKCYQIQDQHMPCDNLVPLINPQCGHVVHIQCNQVDIFTKWKPWPDEFIKSSWTLLKDQHILRQSLVQPKSHTGFINTLPKCQGPITFIRDCTHQVQMICDDAFNIISKKAKSNPCMDIVTKTLTCGHTVQHSCSSNMYDAAYKCKADVLKPCWNFDKCMQSINVQCYKSMATEHCHCDVDTQWQCDNGHLFSLKICQNGIPQDCPSCILQKSIDEADKISSKIEYIFSILNAIFVNSGSIGLIDNAREKILDKCRSLLTTRKDWLEDIPEWKRPMFMLNPILGYIRHNNNNNNSNNKKSPSPNPKQTKYGLGIEVGFLTEENLKSLLTASNETICIGLGFTCQTLITSSAQKVNKKNVNSWVANHQKNGHDSIGSNGSMIFWAPYCFEATHTLVIGPDSVGHLRQVFTSNSIGNWFAPQNIEYIRFVKPSSSNQRDDVNASSAVIITPGELNGTDLDGVGMPATWDGKSLILDKRAVPNWQDEEKILQSKLSFVKKTNADESPFNGIRHLENTKQRGDYLLFMALEFCQLGQTKDFDESLRTYRDELNKVEVNSVAHPLLLVALAKQHGNQRKAKQYLDAFASLYPDAVETWLNADERERLFTSSSSADGTSDKNKKPTVEAEWERLKQVELCRSTAMEDLLKLTGLEKVKEFSISLFKTALKLKKLKNPKANAIALNFAFMGNPGTGKTTVARLFAEILRDSGMRQKNLFLETTAQELKDNGPDKFRDLANSAMDGVLFIDEAHDLDPKGDFKGKPIVAELLTLAENKRDCISFIIAGYQDDIYNKLFTYNEGLKSRFEEVMFEDFNETELKSIWQGIIKEKGVDADDQASSVVARRLVKQSARKGFGNARSVRKMFENALRTAMSRNDWNGSDLTVADIIGQCPSEDSPHIKDILNEIDSMIGWKSIKKSVRELIEQVKKSYQRELEGLPTTPFFVNRIFIGNPGTGKTTCAKLYGRLLKRLNILSNGDVVSKTASDFIGSVVGESANKTASILAQAEGKVLVIDEAYNLNDSPNQHNSFGRQALDTLVEKVQGGDDRAVLLLGYEQQLLEMLRTQNPGLARRFPREYAFKFEDYTDKELLEIFNEACRKQDLRVSSFKVAEKALEVLVKQRMLPNFGNAGSVNLLIQNAVTKASNRPNSDNGGCIEIRPEDIDTGVTEGDPFKLLDSLQNVDNIRNALKRLQRSLSVAKREGTKRPDVGHFVFRGPPGTGKTTVARVMAKILFQMDCLATDRIIETSGLQLTGDYLGQTKTKVLEKLNDAKGGVLFIDEAYELGKGMYGEEAMTTILEAMTNPDYKGLVIVIAGYLDEINEMLDRNPGLKSRFTEYLEFNNWLPVNCVELFESTAQKDGFTVLADAKRRLLLGFAELQNLPGWANGRDVIKLWKDSRMIRDNRVADSIAMPNKDITVDDVGTAIESMTKIDSHMTPQVQTQLGKKQQDSKKPRIQEKTSEIVEEKIEDKEEQAVADDAQRDAGVSDAVWYELEQAKKEYEEKMERLKREKEAAIKEEERKRIKKAIEEELKKQQAIKEKIRQICPCPAGFSWFKCGSGWRCGGGSHFVSDAQLNSQFTI